MRDTRETPPATDPSPAPGAVEVLKSVAWSFFGVQDARTRTRDFTHGRPLPFVVAGFAMTAMVALLFYAAAQLMLRLYG